MVEHRLPEDECICPECGTVMVEIRKEEKDSLTLIPAQAQVQRDVYFTYACVNCKENGIKTPILEPSYDELRWYLWQIRKEKNCSQ